MYYMVLVQSDPQSGSWSNKALIRLAQQSRSERTP
jgi:hypothetical protein